MSKHNVQRCSCGEILRFPAEQEEGLCLTCLLKQAVGQLAETAGPPVPELDSWELDCWEVENHEARQAERARGQG